MRVPWLWLRCWWWLHCQVGPGAGIDSAWDYGQFGGVPPTSTKGSEALIPAAIQHAGARRDDVMITSKIPCSGLVLLVILVIHVRLVQ